LLERARASRLYDAYWRIADPAVLLRRDEELAFYEALLEEGAKGAVVFDIGANQGAKTDVFLRLGASVVAVEPDELNQNVLYRKFHSYRFRARAVTVVPVAVTEVDGSDVLWVDEPGSGKNTLSQRWVDTLRSDDSRFGHRLNFAEQRRVATTTLDSLVARFGEPLFIKIDVEGAEVRVLRGLRRPIRYLSFEVNLPEFLDDGLECVAQLRRLESEYRFNYVRGAEMRLVLTEWLSADAFSEVLSSCPDASIEVFARASSKRL
jgi:FkbM family methyltransferase